MFNPLSLSAFKIELLRNTDILSTATACLYSYDQKVYLITNRHNVTGKYPNDKCISPTGALPDRMKLFFHKKKFNQHGHYIIEWIENYLDLYSFENKQYIPNWYEHPVHGQAVDIVAIPLEGDIFSIKEQGISNEIINSIKSPMIVDFHIFAGMDAFILGYPLKLTGGGHFPIWKRGTIATEYIVNLDYLPKYYVDTATTKSGMSGSPVFIQSTGITYPKGKEEMGNGLLGNCYKFGGIYSGRYKVNNEMADLAIIWKPEAIDEILATQQISSYKYYGSGN